MVIVCVCVFMLSADVILTAGATHGLHLIAHLLFSPGDIAFVENPSYPPAVALLRDQAHLKTLGSECHFA